MWQNDGIATEEKRICDSSLWKTMILWCWCGFWQPYSSKAILKRWEAIEDERSGKTLEKTNTALWTYRKYRKSWPKNGSSNMLNIGIDIPYWICYNRYHYLLHSTYHLNSHVLNFTYQKVVWANIWSEVIKICGKMIKFIIFQ